MTDDVSSGTERSVDRVLLVDKPAGCTSHDVVSQLRRVLGLRRIGHAGTLDPFATGLLLALVGRGTKLFPMLSSLDKVYEGVIRLGQETSTGDPTGETTRTGDGESVTRADAARVAREIEGEQEQVPPMTSAVKHNGQPLYKLNRRGLEVVRKPRRIRVASFEVLAHDGSDVRFRTECSKGTYVRSLAVEFGRRLGVGGHLSSLRRTRIGPYAIDDAVTMEVAPSLAPRELLARHGLCLSDALRQLPVLRLSPSGTRKVRCGAYPTPGDLLDFGATPEPGTLLRLVDPVGDLVAVARSAVPGEGRVPATRIELVRVI